MAVFSCTRIWSGHFWLLFISQLGIAIGQPFVVNGISKLVLEWFPKEQTAIATGLGTMGMFIGMALGMALTPALVEQFGFQKTMEIFAAISIFTCMMFLLFAKKNPTHANLDSQEVTIQESFLPLLQNRSLLKVFILAFLGLGFFNGLTTWIEPILAQSGINSEQAGMVGGVLILGGIVGAVVIPGLSDHFKRRKPFLVGSIWIALLTLYPLCTLRTYSGVLCLAIIQGFFFLPAFALLLEVASELAGERLAGSATGILMLFGNAGGVLVILAMEWVKGDGPSFFPAVLLVLAILTIAAGLAGILPETHQRRKVQ